MKKLLIGLTLLSSMSTLAVTEQCPIDRELQEEEMCVVMTYGEEESFNVVTVLKGEDCTNPDEATGLISSSMTGFSEKFGVREMSSGGRGIGLDMELSTKRGRIAIKTGKYTSEGYAIRNRYTFTCN
jgi:hypothetical protein